MNKHWLQNGIIVAALALLLTLTANAQDDIDPRAQPAIDIIAQSDEFADWLAMNEGWYSDAWFEDEESNFWHIEFYNSDDEWIGYALVYPDTGEITESFAPAPLPQEEFDAMMPRIEAFALQDPEVLAMVGDLSLWEYDTDYNVWDQEWETYFSRGLDAWVVSYWLEPETDNIYISGIEDGNALDEDEQLTVFQDQAIALAYEADGIDQALDGYDDWTTYVEKQDGNWSVEFVSGDEELFYALVDINNWQVIESAGR